MKCHIVVLAAGQSSRFNGIKQLAKINQQTLLERIIHCVSEAENKPVSVTLGANAEALKGVIGSEVHIIAVPDWLEGMSASIRQAIEQLKCKATHIMFVLADQVDLSAKSIEQCWLYAEKNPEAIICAEHDRYQGPPVIFPAQYFDQLSALSGDIGARKVIQQNSDNVINVNLPEALVDIDTKHDLEAWKKHQDQ